MDVDAFLAGWRHEQESGNLASWQLGDMNQDGVTNLVDAHLFRVAYNSANPGGSLNLFGNNEVPEPASLAWFNSSLPKILILVFN